MNQYFKDQTTLNQLKDLHEEFIVFDPKVSFGQQWVSLETVHHARKAYFHLQSLLMVDNQKFNKNISNSWNFHTF